MLGHNDTALKWSFGIEKTKIIYSCSHFANIFANFLQGRVFLDLRTIVYATALVLRIFQYKSFQLYYYLVYGLSK